jgi:RNA polymerase sigma-70 factor (ECF subfamily)
MDVDPNLPPCPKPATNDPDFRRLVDEHARFLFRALRHLGVREGDLDDVCQDLFVVAHRKYRDFRGESSVRTWLYGIAVRLASEHRRRAHVRREVPTSEPPGSEVTSDGFEQLEQRELRELFNSILDGLDDDKRAVFVLYEVEELEMKQIAEAVGCPLQTAYSRLHAARRYVAEAIRQRRPELERQPTHGP